MKKLKIGFGEGGFQGFMARHVEKCVLVAVILLMAWFIYSGAGKSDVKITRERLKQTAQEAESKITNSRWEEVAPERTPRTNPYRIILDQKDKIDSRAYANTSWDHPLVPRLMPRLDPKYIAAEKVLVTPYIGPLVLAPPDDEDAKLPPDPLQGYKVVLGGSGGYQGSDSTDEEDGDKPKSRRREKDKDKEPKSGPMGLSSPPGTSSSSSSSKSKSKKGDDPYAAPSSPSGSSSYLSMGGGGTTRAISPEATQGIKAGMGSIVEAHRAMVITAYVPFSKQWEEYRKAFKDAPGGQDPTRDVPQYLAVWVERLDVTDNPTIDPATVPDTEWQKDKVDAKKLAALERQYGATVPELADPDAVDPKLTHPVPPFLLTDLRPVLLHPDVERATTVVQKVEEEPDPEFIDTGEGVLLDDESEDGAQGGSNRGVNRGMSSGFMNKGSSKGSSGFGGGSGGHNPYAGSGGKSRGMSGASMSGSGMGFGGGSINLETYRPVPKKLVRFVDFSAQEGRKYRYRVKLVLEDPNRPKDPDAEPEPTTLDDEVLKRIKALEAAEAKGAQRRYYVTSPWSAPSDVVSMQSPERFYAGETIPPTPIIIGGAAINTTEPVAKVLAVAWDPKLRAFTPAEQSVHRASVLNVKADVEVIHPVLGDLRKVEGYDLKTDGVVLDILGGEKLPGTENIKEIVRAPGETLILDANGDLVVTDESRDIEGYRKYIFPEPKQETKDKSKSDAPEGSSSMGPTPGGSSMGPVPGGSSSSKGQGYPTGKGKTPKAPKAGK